MKDHIYLTIVIPAYKEQDRIHIILEAVAKYEKTKDFQIETIVVVDGSPDDTAKVARTFSGRLSNLKVIESTENKGKGGAVKNGIMAARGEYVIFADADNATPVEQVDKLLEYVPKFEVVIGSRYTEGGRLAIPQSFVRRVGSRGLNFFIQVLAVYGIHDTQCGFKLFLTSAAREIFKRMTIGNFSFDVEILAIAKQLGYKIREVGITWYDNPHSTVNPLKDGIRGILDAWKIRQNIISGKYR